MISEIWRSLLYPGSLQPRPDWGEPGLPHMTVHDLETDNGDFIELFGPDEPLPKAAAQIVFFYGNGMTARDCAPALDLFGAYGNVWIPEYVGYGRSTGRPSEGGCRASAETAYHYLTKEKAIDPARLVLIGFSLGAAVAIDLASRCQIGSLIALNAFLSLGAMATKICFGAPVGRLLGQRFDNLKKMSAIRCPILIANGESDTLVPCKHGQQLAQANRQAKFVAIPCVGHNDLLGCGDPSLVTALDIVFESFKNPSEEHQPC